jgi:hypothetical protein
MKVVFTTLAILHFFLLIPGFGQQNKPVISFSEKEFNFGTFRESSGIVSHDFHFANTGKIPLIVNDVKASCGCTVPEWPREPVLPGKNGIIKVNFDPKKQSGSFNKSIQVSSNADVPLVTLFIKGVVIPTEQVEEVYKFTLGEIRLQTIYAAFGEIYKGQSATFTIKVFNNSHETPATLSFRQVPSHLKIRILPETIDPQQEGRIELEYRTEGVKDWDYVVDRLELLINGKVLPNNRINITANIKEDFSKLSALEMEAAPRLEFDSQQFDFGTVADKAIVEHEFKLTNTGKSNLLIRKVSASCGCTAVQPAKLMISPGESTTIKAIFNATGREGNQKKAITVITNDPRRSRSILWINGTVVKSSEKAPQ